MHNVFEIFKFAAHTSSVCEFLAPAWLSAELMTSKYVRRASVCGIDYLWAIAWISFKFWLLPLGHFENFKFTSVAYGDIKNVGCLENGQS